MTETMSSVGRSKMAAAGGGYPHQHGRPNGISQAHRDVTDERYRDLRRPRKVRFYCNGDRYFKGKKIYVTPHRYLTFNDMLNDLTSKLPGSVNLPYGVRQIFTPDGAHRIRDIEQLQDGSSYVVAGFENFKQIKYGSNALEPWSHGKAPHSQDFESYEARYGASQFGQGGGPQRAYYGAFHPSKTLRQSYPMGGNRPAKVGTFGQRPGYFGGTSASQDATSKPKVITVVRNGSKPRANVKILLNRRSVQSFEHLQKDISEAFGPKWKNNKVRKLFTVKGREVQGVSDFFRDEDIFIAIGNESLTTGDVHDILDELYPDSPYPKSLMKEWEKTKKRYQPPPAATVTPKLPENSDIDDKIDSGLGSDVSNKDDSERDEVIFKGRAEDNYQRKKKKRAETKDEDLVARLEKERLKAAEEERERARRRMQKKMEAERRALDEDRRKRGLIPLKPLSDPFKKMQEEREREKEKERETERREREAQEKAHRQEEEKLQREREARERVRRDETPETPKVIVVVKDQKEGRRSKAKRRDSIDEEGHRSQGSKSRTRRETGYDSDKENDDRSSQRSNQTKEDSALTDVTDRERERERNREREEKERLLREEREREDRERRQKEKEEKERLKREREEREKAEEEERLREMEREKEKERKKAEEEQKEKERKEKELLRKKRSKSRIIYKTKLERQISNVDHVLEKYEPGKTMGDGNFAIVKQCKLKDTTHEYAMKIIDKSKLKGKEHMIENEIEIMKLCNQPNIVKLVEEFETHKEIYLIMELVKGGDLFDAITQSVKFGEPESASMVSDLTNALFYLHTRGIVHRDLKPENLLVCRNKDGTITLKLADFGLAMEVKEPIFTVCGTPTYVAPEILSEIGYGLEVDMWAVGVITYILLCGFPPFRSPDRNQTELFEFIKAGEYEFLSPYWDNISKAAKDLISRLLIVDKKKRYSAIDVLCHPWVITRGGAVRPSEPMDDYRKNLRRELEMQSKANRESYIRHKAQG